ncbi:FAD-dependent monooxygenase [Mycobacterium sp. TNTM28]|uniref:FAD-dependent monooxygenase n=1 Tax=[Mycobacterium] fortunisiensis TaxID=2600579 RepID=A0ABS6KN05_9MYCO|nr:NAD(P)/FAD-dependent oxidoreductase [[Mycobacterium] fortunisiensis]MBU9765000.1 FAD-dependent monooxygenase [[Mycobacterium] fortunisiensis]
MRVGIVGGGFAGLAAAIAFRDNGHDVAVFEKSAGPVTAGGAISLAQNALTCLTMLGVRDRVVGRPQPNVAATVRDSAGRVLVRSTLARLTGGREYATVPRHQLLSRLTEQLPTECVHYCSPVLDAHADGTLQIGSGRQKFDLVVGADGPHGVIRRTLWPHAPALRATGATGWAWIADRELPTGFGTIWGRTAQFGVLPLADGRTYVYGGSCLPDVDLASFRDWPYPLPDLIDAAEPDQVITPTIFEARPPLGLVRGNVVLIGDAAHTMQPTFGQGAALGMEDAVTLARHGPAALSRRLPRMLALYGMSKAGALFATPRLAALEKGRNLVLRLTPDPVFGLAAGSVSRWTPPPD